MSHVCFLLQAFQHQGKLLKTHPLGHASDVPLHNLALFYTRDIFKEFICRISMLQMELRQNRLARATTAHWCSWLFLPCVKHVTQPGFKPPSLKGPFHLHLPFYRWKKSKIQRNKRTKREHTGVRTQISQRCICVLPPTPRCCHENESFCSSERCCKTLVRMLRSTNFEIPMT